LFGGTGTSNWLGAKVLGVNGPVLTAPSEVATKKFTREPAVNPLPLMPKTAPDRITGGSDATKGKPGLGVGVAVGLLVDVGVGVIWGVGVGVGTTGRLNSSTRLSMVSAAYRLPVESNPIPDTPHRVSASVCA